MGIEHARHFAMRDGADGIQSIHPHSKRSGRPIPVISFRPMAATGGIIPCRIRYRLWSENAKKIPRAATIAGDDCTSACSIRSSSRKRCTDAPSQHKGLTAPAISYAANVERTSADKSVALNFSVNSLVWLGMVKIGIIRASGSESELFELVDKCGSTWDAQL